MLMSSKESLNVFDSLGPLFVFFQFLTKRENVESVGDGSM